MDNKSTALRGPSRYRVVAVRSLRRTEKTPAGQRTEERVQNIFTLGPYRWKLHARLVAWLNRFDRGGWVQRCTVEQTAEGAE
ncbi:hypothetical protein GCM10007320_09010 [Pseudorhodoferax aquiterrae]|uniref:Uncharacterized protein n=1 Tax=Pseudorhodoferax aquiterrae TaxID=747304 RepID=A0ABQ3FX24_9BURK|nr:hypothetical protein [Pseudorhodoferax aquiterrae]GHC72845.1 hypothetical protein GCM10007320_09010 [Pseudorhodoferax aquiterrae]